MPSQVHVIVTSNFELRTLTGGMFMIFAVKVIWETLYDSVLAWLTRCRLANKLGSSIELPKVVIN